MKGTSRLYVLFWLMLSNPWVVVLQTKQATFDHLIPPHRFLPPSLPLLFTTLTMVAINRTVELRELCSKHPEVKPRKRAKRAEDTMHTQAAQAYIAEGYTIVRVHRSVRPHEPHENRGSP